MKHNLKRRVWIRDKYTCHYCGEKNLITPTVDHIIPRSLGGEWSMENLVTACQDCNKIKGNILDPVPGDTVIMRLHQVKKYESYTKVATRRHTRR